MDSKDPDKMIQHDLDDSGCVQDALSSDGYKGQVELLDLSDDVLLYILQHCTPQDLKALGHTCPRLGSLICDRTLWTQVDCRTSPSSGKRLRWLLTHCLNIGTHGLQLRGFVKSGGQRCMGLKQDCANPRPSFSQVAVSRLWPFWPDNIEEMKEAIRNEVPDNVKAGTAASLNKNESSLLNLSCKTSGQSDKISGASDNVSGESDNVSSASDNVSGESDIKSGDLNKNASCSSKKSEHVAQNSGNSSNSSHDLVNYNNNITTNSNNSGPSSSTAASASSISSNSASNIRNFKKVDCNGPCVVLTSTLLKELKIKCPDLTTLALEYCDIDYQHTKITQFPPKLKKLSFKGSRLFNLNSNGSFLCKINDRLPELEYFDISECEWFEPGALMPLSKLPKLHTLYMRKCTRLTECVAYASLAGRYGFKQLKVLDVRESMLSDSEVSALGWLPKLEKLWASPRLQNPAPIHSHWLTEKLEYQELDDWELDEPEYYKCNKVQDEAMDLSEDDVEPDNNTATTLADVWPIDSSQIIVIPGPVIHRRRNYDNGDVNRGPINLSTASRIIVSHLNRQNIERSGTSQGTSPGTSQGVNGDNQRTEKRRIEVGTSTSEVDDGESKEKKQKNDEASHSDEDKGGDGEQSGGKRKQDESSSQVEVGLKNGENSNVGESEVKITRTVKCCKHCIHSKQNGQSEPSTSRNDDNNTGNSSNNGNNSNNDNNPGYVRFRRVNFNSLVLDVPERTVSSDGRPIETPIRVITNAQGDVNIAELLRSRVLPPPTVNARDIIAQMGPNWNRDPDSYNQPRISGSDLVSDSAVMRFGRADNDNVNYVDFGRTNHVPAGPNDMRPDRSSLRFLSMTGYRNITDNSLVHLSTAAPNLMTIDFSETGVTERGVKRFKAVRPECEVIYSKFSSK